MQRGSCGIVAAADAREPDPAAAASVRTAKTGTQYKADADMQAVLDELALLGGNPIETLTPDEAGKQPTPADAVFSLLKKRGKDTSPAALAPDVMSADRQIPGAVGKLAARVYTPAGAGLFPGVVYFRGGGWSSAISRSTMAVRAACPSKHRQLCCRWTIASP